MAQPQRCSVRRYATEARVDGVKQLIYVASCAACGWRHQSRSKSRRNREADQHI
jgi:hypothetical protein